MHTRTQKMGPAQGYYCTKETAKAIFHLPFSAIEKPEAVGTFEELKWGKWISVVPWWFVKFYTEMFFEKQTSEILENMDSSQSEGNVRLHWVLDVRFCISSILKKSILNFQPLPIFPTQG